MRPHPAQKKELVWRSGSGVAGETRNTNATQCNATAATTTDKDSSNDNDNDKKERLMAAMDVKARAGGWRGCLRSLHGNEMLKVQNRKERALRDRNRRENRKGAQTDTEPRTKGKRVLLRCNEWNSASE